MSRNSDPEGGQDGCRAQPLSTYNVYAKNSNGELINGCNKSGDKGALRSHDLLFSPSLTVSLHCLSLQVPPAMKVRSFFYEEMLSLEIS